MLTEDISHEWHERMTIHPKSVDSLAIRAVVYIAAHSVLCLLFVWFLNALETTDVSPFVTRLYFAAALGIAPISLSLFPSLLARAIATVICLGITVAWMPFWLLGFVFGLIAGGLPAIVISLPVASIAWATYTLGRLVVNDWRSRTVESPGESFGNTNLR